MNKLSIKNLSKSYQNTCVVDKFSLEIENGVLGILGPNGAGKTTLLKLITGLIKKDSGEISFNDTVCNQKTNFKEHIGYLPQHFSIYKDMKIYDVLEYIALLKNFKSDNIQEYIDGILKKTNLYSQKDKKIKALSGGMLRRVGLCQALIGDPSILIIDEPTTGLDPANRISFRNLINDIAKDKIIIITTHIVEDVEATCDFVCIMNKGNSVFIGSLQELKNTVQNNIYEIKLNINEFESFEKSQQIISYKRENEFLIVRYIDSDNKFKGAV